MKINTAKAKSHLLAQLVLGLSVLTLSACGGKQPGVLSVRLSFGITGDVDLADIFSSHLNDSSSAPRSALTVDVLTDTLSEDVAGKATSAKLTIGSKTFAGIRTATMNYYQFALGSRCNSFLIGDNINFRYEIYDQAGNVLQQKSVTVPHVDAC